MTAQDVASKVLAEEKNQGAQMVFGDQLMDMNTLGEYIGVKPQTIRIWRTQGVGPKGFKINNHFVRWRKSDVDAWLDSQREAA